MTYERGTRKFSTASNYSNNAARRSQVVGSEAQDRTSDRTVHQPVIAHSARFVRFARDRARNRAAGAAKLGRAELAGVLYYRQNFRNEPHSHVAAVFDRKRGMYRSMREFGGGEGARRETGARAIVNGARA